MEPLCARVSGKWPRRGVSWTRSTPGASEGLIWPMRHGAARPERQRRGPDLASGAGVLLPALRRHLASGHAVEERLARRAQDVSVEETKAREVLPAAGAFVERVQRISPFEAWAGWPSSDVQRNPSKGGQQLPGAFRWFGRGGCARVFGGLATHPSPLPKLEEGRTPQSSRPSSSFLGARVGDQAEVRERRQQRLKRRARAPRAGDRRLGDRRGAE